MISISFFSLAFHLSSAQNSAKILTLEMEKCLPFLVESATKETIKAWVHSSSNRQHRQSAPWSQEKVDISNLMCWQNWKQLNDCHCHHVARAMCIKGMRGTEEQDALRDYLLTALWGHIVKVSSLAYQNLNQKWFGQNWLKPSLRLRAVSHKPRINKSNPITIPSLKESTWASICHT